MANIENLLGKFSTYATGQILIVVIWQILNK